MHRMPAVIFIQESHLGRVIFELRDDALSFSQRRFGRRIEGQIPLRRLAPECETRAISPTRPLTISLIGAFLSGGLAWGIVQSPSIPAGAAAYLAEWPGIVCVICIVRAIRWSRRIEYYRFNNIWKRPVLHIIREKAQAAECDAFVAALIRQIELAESDLSPDERAALLAEAREMPATQSASGLVLSRWKGSIALGILACLLPLPPPIRAGFGGLLLPVVIVLCAGGASLSVFSFLSKERGRWFGLIGLLLSLVPPAFY
ncbi:MAG TPA: hypothetical protein VHD32_13740 [Candidatus Didemnitutus sp.]|nr:hypothetical protein [Candidatus Didemnitutus sp.]